jgi:hypothetical protein
MAGTALVMANTSLSSNGPSRARWCDSCMCHREACHSERCAHCAQNSIPTAAPTESANVPNISVIGTSPPSSCQWKR